MAVATINFVEERKIPPAVDSLTVTKKAIIFRLKVCSPHVEIKLPRSRKEIGFHIRKVCIYFTKFFFHHILSLNRVKFVSFEVDSIFDATHFRGHFESVTHSV